MKKIIPMLLMVLLMFSGCGQDTPAKEGITISKVVYDELMSAKNENDMLKDEIAMLQSKLETMTGEPVAKEETEVELPSDEVLDENVTVAEEGTTTTASESAFTSEAISTMTLVPFKDNYGIYGFKNTQGDVVIDASFDLASAFSNGIATVTSGGKEGTINKSGEIQWNKVETYTEAVVKPQNDVKEGSSFAKFLEEYRKALTNKDEAYVKAHTHPNVKISFGGHSGWDDLVSYWKLDEGSDGFYKMMKTTLTYGAVDTSGGLGNAYTVPYYFQNFPSDYDAFTYSVCVGEGVNLRSRPTTESEVIGTASYSVLKVLAPEKDGWIKVMMPSGDRAYIHADYLKSPIGYRATFTKVDNTWLLDFFVKGD